jgi:hypothetical protein
MPVSVTISVLLDVKAYSLVDYYQCFGGKCCLHFQGRRVLLGPFCPDDGCSVFAYFAGCLLLYWLTFLP